MLILAVDTATSVCSLALYDGKTVLAEWNVDNGLTHSEKLMPQLDMLLKSSGIAKEQLEGIAITTGPGSFTGLRIGLAAVKTIAYVLDIPVVGVPVHTSLAWNVMVPEVLLSPLIDAQKENVYQAIYKWENDKLCEVSPTTIRPFKEAMQILADSGKTCFVLGEDIKTKEEFSFDNIHKVSVHLAKPKAISTALASYQRFIEQDFDDIFTLQPYYLKKSEAEVLWEKRQQNI